ncbi:MAG TPA: hypothetical protein VGM32_00870 [Rhodopila sp.]|jgi:hypothetical protein
MLASRPPFAGRMVSETAMRLSAPNAAGMTLVTAAGSQRFIPVL